MHASSLSICLLPTEHETAYLETPSAVESMDMVEKMHLLFMLGKKKPLSRTHLSFSSSRWFVAALPNNGVGNAPLNNASKQDPFLSKVEKNPTLTIFDEAAS